MTQQYTIKQIEWRNVEGNSSILIASVGVIGTYFIKNFKETAKWGHYDDLCFSGLFPAPDFESCKAAAQAHFEERVKQMLDPVESQWQPIETAPKGPILVCDAGVHPDDFPSTVATVWWELYRNDCEAHKWIISICSRHEDMEVINYQDTPTHWMPLPAPPTEKE